MIRHGCGLIVLIPIWTGCQAQRQDWPRTELAQSASTSPQLDQSSHSHSTTDQALWEKQRQLANYQASFEPPPDASKPAMVIEPQTSGGHVASMSAASLDTAPRTQKNSAKSTTAQVRPSVQGIAVRAVRETNAHREPEVVANVSLDTVGVRQASTLREYITELEQVLHDSPNDVQAQLKLRYLYLAEGMTDHALQTTTAMDPDSAAALQRVFSSIVAAESVVENPDFVDSETLSAIEGLLDWTRLHSDVEIPTVKLCTGIHSFGRYDPIPTGFFVAGQENRAYLYCEVKNFTSKTTDDGNHEVRIAHQLELLTDDGQSLWRDTQEWEVKDECANKRSDFFFNRLWHVPSGISAGDYILKITVIDKLKSQVSEARHAITVHDAALVRN